MQILRDGSVDDSWLGWTVAVDPVSVNSSVSGRFSSLSATDCHQDWGKQKNVTSEKIGTEYEGVLKLIFCRDLFNQDRGQNNYEWHEFTKHYELGLATFCWGTVSKCTTFVSHCEPYSWTQFEALRCPCYKMLSDWHRYPVFKLKHKPFQNPRFSTIQTSYPTLYLTSGEFQFHQMPRSTKSWPFQIGIVVSKKTQLKLLAFCHCQHHECFGTTLGTFDAGGLNFDFVSWTLGPKTAGSKFQNAIPVLRTWSQHFV